MRKYVLCPVAEGPCAGLDAQARLLLGLVAERWKLSYRDDHYQDDPLLPDKTGCFVLYKLGELSAELGCSERTTRRTLEMLRDEGLIKYRKGGYQGGLRIYLADYLIDWLELEARSAYASQRYRYRHDTVG